MALMTALLAVALAWPSHALGAFDGLPLTGTAEALVVGLVLPALWFVDRRFLVSTAGIALVVLLLAIKAVASAVPQEGWCARFTTSAPFTGTILTMPVDEPRGVLRSWDVRADWRRAEPTCTAVLDRPLREASAFPAWFINLLDYVRPGRRDLTLDVDGQLVSDRSGDLAVHIGPDMSLTGHVDDQSLQADGGGTARASLGAGAHRVSLRMRFGGERWAFVPTFNDQDVWTSALVTTTPSPFRSRASMRLVSTATTLIVVGLIVAWSISAWQAITPSAPLAIWSISAALLLAWCAVHPALERFAALALLAAVALPVPMRLRSSIGAFVLLGVPWLAFFAARSLANIGHVSAYSADDWLAYQVAGYRIVMGGYWLEGGTKAFDYQPLYRWITGLLHLVFGDSSVGELYLDAVCLLSGALLTVKLVQRRLSFRSALAAAAAMLATCTVGTIWYFVGRGLSEIAAAGLLFATAFALLAVDGRVSVAAWAGVLAALTFYTRLNHLLLAACLVVLMWPFSVDTTRRAIADALRRCRLSAAAAYLTVLLAGVLAFMTRTWWYTGVFGLFYGTALKNNDIGLRVGTIGSADVWRRVAHSVGSLVWMNEPPHPDVRAAVVAAGTAVALCAALQLPRLRRVPASIVVVILCGLATAMFVHTHNYPGRMTIHLLPFAAAAAAIGASNLAGGEAVAAR